MRELVLRDTKIRDDRLGGVRALKHLKVLNLLDLDITDAGLANVARLTELQRLDLPDSITDDGLKHLKDLQNIEEIGLDGDWGRLTRPHPRTHDAPSSLKRR